MSHRFNWIFFIFALTALLGCSAKISHTAMVSSKAIPVLTITNPATDSFLNNESSITISGTCQDNHTVHIKGDLNSTTPCSAGAFSFTHSPVTDGKFQYSLSQVNSKNVVSIAKTITWTRDTLPPDEIQITSPTIIPFFSGDDSLIISGLCEIGAIVQLEDTATQTTKDSLN